jgi:hypothetical protein
VKKELNDTLYDALVRIAQAKNLVVFGGATNCWIVMEYDVEQRVMNVNVAVVID